jgi:hypothetical protein
MIRHRIRRFGGFFLLLACLTFLTGKAEAQVGALGSPGVLDDPFAFYYGVFLPNQMLQTMRPTPLDSVNNAMVARQYYSQTDRRGLYNPISPYADQSSNPLQPFSAQGKERMSRPFRFSQDPSNGDGMGPSLYYNRAAQYFPGLAGKDTRYSNSYAYTGSRGRGGRGMGGRGMGGGGGGGMGMGGMGRGMGIGGMGMGMGGGGGGMGMGGGMY